jgi:exopolyphosphatase / guanosine-5'-triphosphate,3'-diphosphate pyrophosphatase
VIVGVVDVGSTSTRLLVTDGERDLERRTVVTRLGDGVGEGAPLPASGRAATAATLEEYRRLLDAAGAGPRRLVATSSVRRAADGGAFLAEAAARLGAEPVLLSGTEEGEAAFAGATAALHRRGVTGRMTVVDLGGGSCEFATGVTACEGVFSAEFGAARLTEAWIESDPPRPEELVAVLSVVDAHLDDVVRELPAVAETDVWVGVGGTMTTFAAVEIGLAAYDRDAVHGFALTRAAAEDVYRVLVSEPLADRVHNPGLPRDRAEVIVGGACALVAMMRRLRIDRFVISDADLLDGVAARLLAGG